MILTCTNCATRFLVADAALGPEGRRVRCALCNHIWFQMPPQEVETLPPLPDDLLTHKQATSQRVSGQMPSLPHPARTKPRILWRVAAVVAVLWILCGVGMWIAKTPINQLWPSTTPLYGRLGLDVPHSTDGLTLETILVRTYKAENTAIALLVQGEIRNTSALPKALPTIALMVNDPAGRPILGWSHNEAPARLEPGETRPFHTQQVLDNELASTVTLYLKSQDIRRVPAQD